MSRHGSPPLKIIPALDRLRADLYDDIPDFKKLPIRKKQEYIRTHGELIRLFAAEFGDPAAMRLFALPELTLKSIKERENKHFFMSKAEEKRLRDQIILEAIKNLEKRLDHLEVRFESVPEIRKEIRETREEFEQFTEISAARVAKLLIEPLLKSLVANYGVKLPAIE